MMAEGGDWTGDWVLNAIAARVQRAGPRPVSEDHKPGLVSPDLDWLINALTKINTKRRPESTVVQHAGEVMHHVIALRARGLGPVNLAGNLKKGFTTRKRTTKSAGRAKELRRLQRAAASESPTRWIKAWAAAPYEIRRLIWSPVWGPIVRHNHFVFEPEIGPCKVGFTRTGPTDIGIAGGALIGPKPEDVAPMIDRALRQLATVPANNRRGNKYNEEADVLSDVILSVIHDLCGRITITNDRIIGKDTGPLADFGGAFDRRFGTAIKWRLIDKTK